MSEWSSPEGMKTAAETVASLAATIKALSARFKGKGTAAPSGTQKPGSPEEAAAIMRERDSIIGDMVEAINAIFKVLRGVTEHQRIDNEQEQRILGSLKHLLDATRNIEERLAKLESKRTAKPSAKKRPAKAAKKQKTRKK